MQFRLRSAALALAMTVSVPALAAGQLPRNVVPISYNISVSPDAQALAFRGQERIAGLGDRAVEHVEHADVVGLPVQGGEAVVQGARLTAGQRLDAPHAQPLEVLQGRLADPAQVLKPSRSCHCALSSVLYPRFSVVQVRIPASAWQAEPAGPGGSREWATAAALAGGHRLRCLSRAHDCPGCC